MVYSVGSDVHGFIHRGYRAAVYAWLYRDGVNQVPSKDSSTYRPGGEENGDRGEAKWAGDGGGGN